MDNIFYLQTKNTTYALGVDKFGLLRHLYWGKRLSRRELTVDESYDTNSNHSMLDNALCEYTVFGGKMYRNCAFKCIYPDKCRDSVFLFKHAKQEENELVVTLTDKVYKVDMVLHYITYPDSDIITRYAVIENHSPDDVLIEKLSSCEVNLPGEAAYDIINTQGGWGAEFQKQSTTLRAGYLVFDSRKGTTGHTNQPIFIAHRGANESSGEVYFGALGYSGNFKAECQRDYSGVTRIVLGMSDFDFSYTLKSGESLSSPKAYIGFSCGFSQMTHEMHRFAVNHILPKSFAHKPLPVLYNSWEATGFDVSCENQLRLAQKAASLGCELFVTDDGWFGKRNNDRAGLGDWFVNEEKFPGGLDELIDGVNALGMDFGLWFEPEMVQRESELFEQHPDWIYHYKTRVSGELRHQLVLNLTKPEVEEYVFSSMDKMLSRHNIRFIKWDMNRPLSEIGADNLENEKEIWLRHTQAVYRVADRLKQKYPYLQLEACASGGGRADLGAMEHFDSVWTSDNTDPLDRLVIQNGFSLLYLVKCMRAWVTDWNSNKRPVSLDYRFASSMQGSLSLGANLERYNDEDMKKAGEYIALYKQIRSTVQFGDMYRICTGDDGNYWATQYVDGEQSVLFVMSDAASLENTSCKRLRLKGLDPDRIYSYTLGSDKLGKSGEYLMNVGLDVDLKGPLRSKIVVFK